MLRLAIDIGGTFTDVVTETPEGMSSVKVLTTQSAPQTAALDGVERLLAKLNKSYGDISDVVHGTTLATNALIERRGARTALVTTAGFRDVLEMRNEKRFAQYALDIELPEPLVPRSLRLGLTERILANGSVAQAPDDGEIDALCDRLVEQNVEAVAIGFLHSYKNPTHEQMVAERLRSRLGNAVTVCMSSEVAGEIREYERFSTVCANAYVRPLVSRYIGKLHSTLQESGFSGSFLMMLSDGALTTWDQAIRFPIRLVEGGPAGGVALAAHVAREVGSKKTLSLDIGGTTAKICFIEDGTPKTTRRFEIARAWRNVKGSGLPAKIPTVELVEIGAGGGSIASVDTLGRLNVGPRSAGSMPGPAAYNQGGADPTITDAHLTLGNISAEGFADGMIALDSARAPAAIASHVQHKLGMETVEPAAAGIIELADETMSNAARVHGIELGLDVSGYDLLVSGGGGGLHAARIADKLGIRRIIVPEHAGVGSAVGFLRSPVAYESAISVVQPLSHIDRDELAEQVEHALEHVRDIVAAVVPRHQIECAIKTELRYQGQGLEISLPLPDVEEISLHLNGLSDRFEGRYLEQVGFTLSDIAIELVSVSVTAREQRTTSTPSIASRTHTDAATNRRSVFDLGARQELDYCEIERTAMNGEVLSGPAVVAEPQTTTLVRPGWSVHRLKTGHLVMEKSAQ